jgi:hypothetical protein
MQLITVISLRSALDQYIVLLNSPLPSFISCFSTPFFLTGQLPAYTPTPLSSEVQPTVQHAVDVLSMCGIEQLNHIVLQLKSYTLRCLRQGFRNGRPGGECLVSKHIFGLCFLKFIQLALNSAGSITHFVCFIVQPCLTGYSWFVIIKYMVFTFMCSLRALARAFCISLLNHTMNSEIF